MASIKVVSLAIRTLSKPIANRIKLRAQDHKRFRGICVNVAQAIHRFETRAASSNFLGSNASLNIRPLSESKAIQQGANALSEAFLFAVALSLIMAENLRSRMQSSSRRDTVDQKLEDFDTRLGDFTSAFDEARRADRARIEALEWSSVQSSVSYTLPHRPASLDNDVLVLQAELALLGRH